MAVIRPFKFGKLTVSPGEWYVADYGAWELNFLVCDDKVDEFGMCVFVQNTLFPDNFEGSMLNVEHAPFTSPMSEQRLEELKGTQFYAASQEFLQGARALNFN